MSIQIVTLTIDCHDALAVSDFWSATLERPVEDGASPDYASVLASERGPALAFTAVPEGKTVKNRLHLDLHVNDRTTEVARLVGLGAQVCANHEDGDSGWTVLQDVEGNEFCVV